MRGRFIVLEGIDGSGKTCQARALADWLPTSGLMPRDRELVVTREPGGTAFGEALRELLLNPPPDTAPCGRAELLLYAADRAQHVAERIAPALAAGHWVISDRFTGSTAAYQGHGRGLPLEVVAELERFATGGIQPDLTLWLDLPVEEALRRLGNRQGDRIESEGEAFLARVWKGFQALAQSRGWVRIDATGTRAEASGRCRDAIWRRLRGGRG